MCRESTGRLTEVISEKQGSVVTMKKALHAGLFSWSQHFLVFR
jgi:hypothetical protein